MSARRPGASDRDGGQFGWEPPTWDDRRRVPVSLRTTRRVEAGPSSGNRASFVCSRGRGPKPGNIGITCRGVPMASPPEGTSARRLRRNRCHLAPSHWPASGLCLVLTYPPPMAPSACPHPCDGNCWRWPQRDGWVALAPSSVFPLGGSPGPAKPRSQYCTHPGTHPEGAQGTSSRPVWWVLAVWTTDAMPRCSEKSGPTQTQTGHRRRAQADRRRTDNPTRGPVPTRVETPGEPQAVYI